MKKLNKKGFTLVEMLVVIAIIAVLVAIIIPTTSSATTKAKAAADAANLRSLVAEATIDILEDDVLTNDYTMDSKLFDTKAVAVQFYNTANGLVGFYDDGTNKATVASFAAASESGSKGDAAATAPTDGTLLVKGKGLEG